MADILTHLFEGYPFDAYSLCRLFRREFCIVLVNKPMPFMMISHILIELLKVDLFVRRKIRNRTEQQQKCPNNQLFICQKFDSWKLLIKTYHIEVDVNRFVVLIIIIIIICTQCPRRHHNGTHVNVSSI